MDPDRYDAWLSPLHAYAPLYPKSGVELANHAPMVLDALLELGAVSHIHATDHVDAWLSASIISLVPLPQGNVIGVRERVSALGDTQRTPDWVATFEGELSTNGIERTLKVVLPLLTPGVLAASLHGVLRTAHALRALSRRATPARRTELAHGLASWAAGYQLLPGLERPVKLAGARPAALSWLDETPLLAEPDQVQGLLHEIVHPLATHGPWLEHVLRLGPVVASEQELHRIAAWSAQRLALDPQGSNAHLHGVTVASSLSWFIPWVEPRQLEALTRQVILALGAVHAASASGGSSQCAPAEPLPLEALIEHALESRDDHALKLTEAVLRIEARGLVEDPWLRRAAEKWVRRAVARRAA